MYIINNLKELVANQAKWNTYTCKLTIQWASGQHYIQNGFTTCMHHKISDSFFVRKNKLKEAYQTSEKWSKFQFLKQVNVYVLSTSAYLH